MSIAFIDCPPFLAELITPELRAIVPTIELHTLSGSSHLAFAFIDTRPSGGLYQER